MPGYSGAYNPRGFNGYGQGPPMKPEDYEPFMSSSAEGSTGMALRANARKFNFQGTAPGNMNFSPASQAGNVAPIQAAIDQGDQSRLMAHQNTQAIGMGMAPPNPIGVAPPPTMMAKAAPAAPPVPTHPSLAGNTDMASVAGPLPTPTPTPMAKPNFTGIAHPGANSVFGPPRSRPRVAAGPQAPAFPTEDQGMGMGPQDPAEHAIFQEGQRSGQGHEFLAEHRQQQQSFALDNAYKKSQIEALQRHTAIDPRHEAIYAANLASHGDPVRAATETNRVIGVLGGLGGRQNIGVPPAPNPGVPGAALASMPAAPAAGGGDPALAMEGFRTSMPQVHAGLTLDADKNGVPDASLQDLLKTFQNSHPGGPEASMNPADPHTKALMSVLPGAYGNEFSPQGQLWNPAELPQMAPHQGFNGVSGLLSALPTSMANGLRNAASFGKFSGGSNGMFADPVAANAKQTALLEALARMGGKPGIKGMGPIASLGIK